MKLFNIVILAVALSFFSSPVAGIEGKNKNVIAIVKEMNVSQIDSAMEGFLEALDKENISADIKIVDRKDKSAISRIKELKPVLILTMGTAATNMVADQIKDIPILFTMVIDPKGGGIASRNIPGASLDIPVKIQLETLKSVFPRLKRVGVIYNPAENEPVIQEAIPVAGELGITINRYAVRSEREIPRIDDLPIDLLWIVPDNMVCQPAILYRIMQDCMDKKIAVTGISRNYARSGAVLGLSPDFNDVGRQSGEMAAKFFKGVPYPDLKITVPRTLKLYISKTAADIVGITIPDTIIKKASEVF